MQLSLPITSDGRLAEIHRGLLDAFGAPPAYYRLDPVSQLVLTMLSGRTREPIAKRAFARLANRYSSWEDLAHAQPEKIRWLINPVTHAERKAVFLPTALRLIMCRRGALNLNFLDVWPAEAAVAWLETLPGIGPKTSAAILNFSPLHKPVLVVDTAHWRSARRLGLVPMNASFAKASCLLARQIPDDWTADDMENHHMLMQRLGKTYCTHADPACGVCPLHLICPYGRHETAH
ncbi:MAG: endonuclease III domain-containing protein [Pseudomonadota bacterium]